MQVAPGTIAVWSDLGCPWSHAVVWRLHDARRRLGLEGRVALRPPRLSARAVQQRADAAPAARGGGPRGRRAGATGRAGSPGPRPTHAWPVTMLPPMEAVQAAKLQSLRGIRGARPRPAARLLGREPMHQPAPRHPRGRQRVRPSTWPRSRRPFDDGRARRALFDDWAVARGRRGARLGAPLRAGWHERAEPRHRDRLARRWRRRR